MNILPKDRAAFELSRKLSLAACGGAIASGVLNNCNIWRIVGPIISAVGDMSGKWANKVSAERENNGTEPDQPAIDLISGFKDWAAQHPIRITYGIKLLAVVPLFYSGWSQKKYGECVAAAAYTAIDILAIAERKDLLKYSTALQGAAGVMLMSNWFAARGNVADIFTGFAALCAAILTSRVDPEVYKHCKAETLRSVQTAHQQVS